MVRLDARLLGPIVDTRKWELTADAKVAPPRILIFLIREEPRLSTAQIANANIVSPYAARFLRLEAGLPCDQIGLRRAHAHAARTPPRGPGAPRQRSCGPVRHRRADIFDRNVAGTANAQVARCDPAGVGITLAASDSLASRQGVENLRA